MKGVSLPINTVVLLVLAIIVVAGVVLFFTGTLTESSGQMSNDQIKVLCCTRLSCEESSFSEIVSSCNIEGLSEERLKQAFGGTSITEKNILSECECVPKS